MYSQFMMHGQKNIKSNRRLQFRLPAMARGPLTDWVNRLETDSFLLQQVERPGW